VVLSAATRTVAIVVATIGGVSASTTTNNNISIVGNFSGSSSRCLALADASYTYRIGDRE
jgi:hypothetical protein